jgi:hypothetical protein
VISWVGQAGLRLGTNGAFLRDDAEDDALGPARAQNELTGETRDARVFGVETEQAQLVGSRLRQALGAFHHSDAARGAVGVAAGERNACVRALVTEVEDALPGVSLHLDAARFEA